MTPKEKSHQLFDKYFQLTHPYYDIDKAKKCALIAVDEILKCDDIDIYGRKYYKEVKQEIEKI